MHRLAAGQRFEVIFWLALAAIVFALGFVYDVELEMYRFGTTRWPQALAILIALSALGQLYSDLRGFDNGDEADGKGYFQQLREESLGYQISLVLMLVLPLIYTALLEYTGYYFTTPFFLAGYLFLTGERRLKFLVLVPAATYVLLTFVFTTLLYVGLPVGYWPGFYDFSNWVVVLLR